MGDDGRYERVGLHIKMSTRRDGRSVSKGWGSRGVIGEKWVLRGQKDAIEWRRKGQRGTQLGGMG